MLNTSQINKLFTADGHLSEEGIAFWVDALQYHKTDALPEKVREHVENCVVCKTSVLHVYSALEQEDQPLPDHPYFENPGTQTKRPGKRRINLWYSIAASVLILISMIVILLFQLRENESSGDLFAEYFSPYPNIITKRSTATEHQNKTIVAAIAYYDDGEYHKANHLFEELGQPEVLSDTILFYYGNSSLAAGNVNRAIVLFEQLLTETNSRFLTKTEWYLALAYLSDNKPDKCKFLLEKIINKDGHFKSKARELYQKIE